MNKKHIVTTIILICSFCLITSNTYSSSIKEDYELQEKCGKSCKELFSQKYDLGNGSFYNSHYNKKMNKCFISILHLGGPLTIKRKILLDVHGNKDYGIFTHRVEGIIICEVLDTKCNSEKEWDLLVKPYMEE